MRSIKTPLVLACAASLLVVSACNSEQNAKSATPAVTGVAVATVNGTAINQSRVDMIIKHGASAGQADTPEARKSIIDKLTMQTLIAEEAVKKGLDKLPEVTEQLAVLRQSVLADAYVQDFIKNTPVSEDLLKAEYDRIKATITGSEYKARHILVETEAEAQAIIAKLKTEPGSFAKLAMEKSRDAGSKVSGGDLGWFDVSRMVPEFSNAVSTLKKGAFTQEPVKTQYGYHVIFLEDSRAIEAPPFEEVRPELTQQMQQQNLKKQLDELKARAKIEIVGTPAVAR
ncbi:peptidylprolyl isomerase [Accumulibacter sp.]|uniref:peptidylprolyl isomerase n=1 Tax=Accumulibacter sp. TaxID=2053492 RepID=UPI0028C4985E|nr:peptidylprolyl isomerase [Accumulibacter sp.]